MTVPLKKSRQREAILRCVLSHHDHPTADNIYMEVRKDFPNISLGTVYRNLSLLTKLGKIQKITCDDHADHFDGELHHHAHFVCTSCGCLQDFPFHLEPASYENAHKEFQGMISEYSILFRGKCASCIEQSSRDGSDIEIE